jgi:hypothetical protein
MQDLIQYYLLHLFCVSFCRTKRDQLRETSLSSVPLTKEICHMYTQRQTSGLTKMIGKYVCVYVGR